MTSSGHAHSDRQRYDTACRVTGEQALNVAEKMWEYLSCTQCTNQGNGFELTLTVTRRVAVYLKTHLNIGWKTAFPTRVLDG